jgi:hypothetical protein
MATFGMASGGSVLIGGHINIFVEPFLMDLSQTIFAGSDHAQIHGI